MELHQNDSKTMESIKEARAICGPVLPWMPRSSALQLSRKPRPPVPAPSVQEAEALCSTAIRDPEIWGASQADSLQWRHVMTIQHLEEQVIQEEGKSQINFLPACQAALQARPVEPGRVNW